MTKANEARNGRPAAAGARAKLATAGRAKRGDDKRRAFLNHLAATCNVKAAAVAAGAGASYFYGLRRVDDAFAAGWRAAVQAGYDRLEEALLARAIEQVARDGFDEGAVTVELIDGVPLAATRRRAGRPDGEPSPALAEQVARVDVQLALTLLNRRAATERRGAERSPRRSSAAEVETALNDKLDALARRITPLGGEAG